jgi:hypothetical protein
MSMYCSICKVVNRQNCCCCADVIYAALIKGVSWDVVIQRKQATGRSCGFGTSRARASSCCFIILLAPVWEFMTSEGLTLWDLHLPLHGRTTMSTTASDRDDGYIATVVYNTDRIDLKLSPGSMMQRSYKPSAVKLTGQNPNSMDGGKHQEVFRSIALQLNMQHTRGGYGPSWGLQQRCVAGIAGLTRFEGLGECSGDSVEPVLWMNCMLPAVDASSHIAHCRYCFQTWRHSSIIVYSFVS